MALRMLCWLSLRRWPSLLTSKSDPTFVAIKSSREATTFTLAMLFFFIAQLPQEVVEIFVELRRVGLDSLVERRVPARELLGLELADAAVLGRIVVRQDVNYFEVVEEWEHSEVVGRPHGPR